MDTETILSKLLESSPFAAALAAIIIGCFRFAINLDRKSRGTREKALESYTKNLAALQRRFQDEIADLHAEHAVLVETLCTRFAECHEKTIQALDVNAKVIAGLIKQNERLTLAINSLSAYLQLQHPISPGVLPRNNPAEAKPT